MFTLRVQYQLLNQAARIADMTPNKRSILNAALTALGRTTGIEVHVHPAKAGKDRTADAIVEFENRTP